MKPSTLQLHQSNFQSLSNLGVDWSALVRGNPDLFQKYNKLLELQSSWVMVSIDYSQLELYVLASLSGDKNMISTVNMGTDLHRVNTEKIFNINYAQLEREFEEAKSLDKESIKYKAAKANIDLFKSRRKSVKALSFSLSYGAGPEKIAMDQRISVVEARKLINDFYSIYPKVRKWQQDTFLSAIKRGYIETPFGRRRATSKIHGRMDAYNALALEQTKAISELKRSGEYWLLRNELKTCMNTPVQSVASDMCSWAAFKVKEYFKTLDDAAQLLFWVHDSIVFAVHIDSAVDVINRVCAIMEKEVKYDNDPVIYRTSVELGRNYEFCVELSAEEKQTLTRELILSKCDDAVKADLNKKFKLIVKETALDLEDSKTYLNTVKNDKMEQFRDMVEKLGIDGISTPDEYLAWCNGVSLEEYAIAELSEDEENT